MMINKYKPQSETEKIIIPQAVEEGFEQGLEIQLNKIIKKLIIKGKSDQEICDLLDTEETLAAKIRNEVMGKST